MPKLYFYYSAMNAGKSTQLIQANYNYKECGLRTKLFIPEVIGRPKITSRIGISVDAISFPKSFDFLDYLRQISKHSGGLPPECLLIDEGQFLTKEQVLQLTKVSSVENIAVLVYGLRTDFMGELFEGSRYLLALSEEIKEVKTMCHCGRKATMTMRVDEDGQKENQGPQVKIGGNSIYVACCLRHYNHGKVKLLKKQH